MLTRTPDYYSSFRCLAGACPHTCCAKWEVVIDPDTAGRYEAVPGPLGERLRAALVRDEDGDWCFPLQGERCPFLDGENLCEIHRQLGEAATSVTCREHPRFTEDYGPFREITLSASCPAANALLLGSEAPLTFREEGSMEEPADHDTALLLALRDRLLAVLADRRMPLRRRLERFLTAALAAQDALDTWDEDALSALAAGELPPEPPRVEDGPGLFPDALGLLSGLEILEPDWRELLRQAETAPAAEVPEPLLERIAVYFAFRYLLKAVNDGDLLGQAQLCLLAVLTVERLAPVTGLGEALRRFSCEVEHDDGNLEALLEAFRQETPPLAAFFRQLG
ncbi:flagellin lysine-N-methylase [Dysosmobacter sp.]|uniref:flagellin lysine-N-methylase n=1 Tax=Dysosmobacter sp. TaxID=2591382 RepID=UPI002A8CD610|nr:flagellin lysine-N-methylase [Dysosmobacter sp.]MDY3282334.1 flagellin lysine-N-methylase [Dysosmobacter sp.]